MTKKETTKAISPKMNGALRLLLLPNEKWTEDQANQTLQALIEEGKIEEFEPGKYRPTQKLSVEEALKDKRKEDIIE
jgi:hypothetical protein